MDFVRLAEAALKYIAMQVTFKIKLKDNMHMVDHCGYKNTHTVPTLHRSCMHRLINPEFVPFLYR